MALACLVALATMTACPGNAEKARKALRESKASLWAEAKGSALVVMDMQRAFMPIILGGQVTTKIQGLVEAADAAGAPVVWVYTEGPDYPKGSPAYEVAAPLAPAATHFRVTKSGQCAFEDPALEEYLAGKGVGRLVFCGIASDGCVRSSVQASVYMGYLTVVASDAHSVLKYGGTAADITTANEGWRRWDRVEVLPSAEIAFPAATRQGT